MNLIFGIQIKHKGRSPRPKKILISPDTSCAKIGQFLQDYKIEKAIISSVRNIYFIYDL
jgi:hypothetical protein